MQGLQYPRSCGQMPEEIGGLAAYGSSGYGRSSVICSGACRRFRLSTREVMVASSGQGSQALPRIRSLRDSFPWNVATQMFSLAQAA
jgi:hypothetical protein